MRLIDGDELLEKMYRYTDNEGAKMPYGDDDSLIHKDSACFLIENAPTIEPQPRWIPCSERPPEEGVDVLFMFLKNMAVGSFEDGVWCVNSGGGWYTNCYEGDELPIAWMPLPSPYHEEGEEE